MVERPIKKSERQPKANSEGDSDNLKSTPSRKSNRKNSKGKGKKGSFADESKPPVNPALARPPKPPKIQAKEEEPEPEVESEPISPEEQGEKQED
ncbi:MAG: hypothetical protein QNJ51_21190 [Calothrix sp. MO_167.B12]|nr:hypothetical protein [Calothrix sp. MO_167.B12]